LKIEKINDNQIRFTLSHEDLDSRHLRISELAYGSPKARALFQELMQKASAEVGFEAEDIPLMIEAIPMSAEGLVLLVTKVEDPEELDARFSNFTPEKQLDSAPAPLPSCADEIISCFEQLENLISNIGKAAEEMTDKNGEEKTEPLINPEVLEQSITNMSRVFAFDNLTLLRKLSAVLIPFYKGRNSLYKDPKSDFYYLVLSISKHTPAEFNKICNIVSEYGDPAKTAPGTMAYFDEHFKLILADNALKQLSKLN